MKLIYIRIISVVSLVVMLSACGFFGGEKKPVYQGAESYKNLEVPPDLTAPDTSTQLRVPKVSDEALQKLRQNNELGGTVLLPKVEGIRIESNAGISWIEIDKPVDMVWQNLIEFWQAEGISLAEVRPLLGFMETEWTVRLSSDVGFFRKLFQQMQPDQKEKFRARVEKFDDDAKTRLFIKHSRIERIVTGEYGESSNWETQPSDLDAEREIFSRVILFLGMNKGQLAQLMESYRSYSSLVSVDKSNSTTLSMKGSMDFVSQRAMRALERMKMNNIRQEKESNVIYFVAGKLSAEQLKKEEDDLSKSSWLMQLFTGTDYNDDEDAIKEASTKKTATKKKTVINKNRQYRLAFSKIEDKIQIEVIDAKESQTTNEDGHVSSTALTEQIRNLLVEKLE